MARRVGRPAAHVSMPRMPRAQRAHGQPENAPRAPLRRRVVVIACDLPTILLLLLLLAVQLGVVGG